MIWNNDNVANPTIPSPESYGWKDGDSQWQPVINTSPPAPHVVLYLVKCGCKKTRCLSKRCCRVRAKLTCTDMRGCTDTDEICDNSLSHQDVVSDDDSDDGDDASDEEEGHSDIDETHILIKCYCKIYFFTI